MDKRFGTNTLKTLVHLTGGRALVATSGTSHPGTRYQLSCMNKNKGAHDAPSLLASSN